MSEEREPALTPRAVKALARKAGVKLPVCTPAEYEQRLAEKYPKTTRGQRVAATAWAIVFGVAGGEGE